MPTVTEADVTWRVSTPAPLPMRNWDGDYVVYNPLSGNTHILDIVTGEVLKMIATGPARAQAICSRVANFLELPADDGNVSQHVGDILHVLDDLGLIEPANGC
jgi:PqqD family protein of HPr-rel-A system